MGVRFWVSKRAIIIIIIVNLYWGCQHHKKSGLQKGPLKVTTYKYNYVKAMRDCPSSLDAESIYKT